MMTTHARVKIAILACLVSNATFGQSTDQLTFSSADEANRTLFAAIQNHDDRTAMKILGIDSGGMFSGDDVQDHSEREQFAKKYIEMHRLGREQDGALVLYVGAENWPFPFPLVSKGGAWHFDSKAGSEEILFRRIGDNEAAAVQHMMDLVAQKQQQKEATTRADISLDANPFHGYFFKALPNQPKHAHQERDHFGFVAYPVEYRSCGVMAFIVNQDGVVYQKDLGPSTTKLANAITKYSPRGWHAAR